jgi:hypothetical protein
LLSLRFAVLCDITLVVLCQCITPCGSPLALPCPFLSVPLPTCLVP